MFARFSLAASIVLSTLCLAPGARAGATLADTWIEPGSGMEFVLIKGDCYLMGDTFGDGEHNEVPVHEVCLDDYYLGKYEVTQGQWQRVMGDNPAEYAHGENHPVESVMLTEIDAFIHRLNRSSGEVFRLPSEAEWEFACRGGGQAVKYGTADKHISPHNAHIGGEATSPWPGTAPVGSFAANVLGVHDMSGNVWEWVSDIYAADAYSKHQRHNPRFDAPGPSRLVRGGAWSHDGHFARCSKRHMHCRPSVRYDIIGFRLVREVPRLSTRQGKQ